MKRMLIFGGVACVVVITLWIASFLIVCAVWKVPDNGARSFGEYGQFGDSFGAVNALFSGLAFAGVVVALILQREDIDASIKAQRDAATAQQQTADHQRMQAKISALAAALEAKKVMLVYWEEARSRQPAAQPIKDRPRGPNEELNDIKMK